MATAPPRAEVAPQWSRILLKLAWRCSYEGFSKSVTAPLDTVKLILQAQSVPSKSLIKTGDEEWGLIEAFKELYRRHGLKAFWRGNLVNILRNVPTQAIVLIVPHLLIQFQPSSTGTKLPWWGQVMLDSVTGTLLVVVSNPFDVVRLKLVVDVAPQRRFTGARDCIDQIVAKDGVWGLFAGASVSVVGVFLYRALFFKTYGLLRANITSNSRFSLFLMSQVASCVAALSSYPIDTIRREMMLQAGEDDKPYKNELDCAIKIVQTHGVLALWKGALPHILRTFGTAVVMVGFDVLMGLAGSLIASSRKK